MQEKFRHYIGIFCGSSANCHEDYAKATKDLTEKLIANHFGMVFGGSKAGLMEVLADAAVAAQGQIIGVVPPEISKLNIVYPGIQIYEEPNFAARKNRMMSLSNGFIALPGGIGTLDEITEVAIYNMFANIENMSEHAVKPMCLLNLNHFYDGFILQLQRSVAENFLPQHVRDLIFSANSVDEAIAYLNNFQIPESNDHRWWEKISE